MAEEALEVEFQRRGPMVSTSKASSAQHPNAAIQLKPNHNSVTHGFEEEKQLASLLLNQIFINLIHVTYLHHPRVVLSNLHAQHQAFLSACRLSTFLLAPEEGMPTAKTPTRERWQ